jgi:outer membrane protein OmpA-like peptidoglycan-associated protein
MILSLLLSQLSFAQEPASGGEYPQLNAQAFRPSVDSQKLLWITDSTLTESQQIFFRGVFSYTKDPFVYTDYNGNQSELLSDISSLDIISGVAYQDFRIALITPLYFGVVGTSSEQAQSALQSENTSEISTGDVGIGDLTLDFKYRLLDPAEQVIGAQLSLRSSLPTSTTNLATGTDGVLYELEGGVDKEFGPTLLAFNIGHRGIPNIEFESTNWGSQIYTRLGGAYTISDASGTALEFVTANVYSAQDDASKPKEILLSGWKLVGSNDLKLRGGFGFGLNESISSPKYRLILSLGVEPIQDKDTDGDGLLDSVDNCIDNPEDMDGVLDNDGCPEPTIVRVVVVDQFGEHIEDAEWTNGVQSGLSKETYEAYASEGEITFRSSLEGYTESTLAVSVPDAEKFKVTIEMPMILGSLTVKAVDTEGTKIKGATWSFKDEKMPQDQRAGRPVEVRPGAWNISAKADGFKPVSKRVKVVREKEEIIIFEMLPAMAQISGDKIDIKEEVHFETGSDVILENSFELLNEVSQILIDHPELTKLRIEGHTDSRGNDEMNKELSQKRALSVKNYLESKGVKAERMDPVGFGEEQPVATNDTPEGRSQNRRVIFHVAERSDDSP